MKKRLVGNIVEVHELPLSEIAEIRSTISDLEAEIESKREALAKVQVLLRHADHDLRLHRSYYSDSNNLVIISDEAMVQDMQMQRSQLASDLGALTKRLPVLKHQVDEIMHKQAKEVAIAGAKEIDSAAKKMLEAIKAARESTFAYKDLRQSFARPQAGWPFWFAPLLEKRFDRYFAELERFVNPKKR